MTFFGDYLRETGTNQAWLAERAGVSTSKMCRWAAGRSGMKEADRRKVLAVLRERAVLNLDALFDDQPDWPYSVRIARPRSGSPDSPFERFIAEMERRRESLT